MSRFKGASQIDSIIGKKKEMLIDCEISYLMRDSCMVLLLLTATEKESLAKIIAPKLAVGSLGVGSPYEAKKVTRTKRKPRVIYEYTETEQQIIDDIRTLNAERSRQVRYQVKKRQLDSIQDSIAMLEMKKSKLRTDLFRFIREEQNLYKAAANDNGHDDHDGENEEGDRTKAKKATKSSNNKNNNNNDDEITQMIDEQVASEGVQFTFVI